MGKKGEEVYKVQNYPRMVRVNVLSLIFTIDPFIRVLPIKREYGAALMPQFYSLDSQRFGSFEVLAIAGASFVVTITVKSFI